MFAVFIAAKITSFLLLNWISISDNPHLILFLVSGVIGKVEFTVRHLSSATTSFPSSWSLSSGSPCLGNSRQVRNIRMSKITYLQLLLLFSSFLFQDISFGKNNIKIYYTFVSKTTSLCVFFCNFIQYIFCQSST